MTGILPEEIRLRRDKVGFSTPEDTWFRNGLRRFTEDILASESFRSRPHVDPDTVQDDLDRHLAGERNRSEALWRTLNLELWLRTFVDPTETYHR
jgi:asparagine synthase (glutamine-hydrolysing)